MRLERAAAWTVVGLQVLAAAWLVPGLLRRRAVHLAVIDPGRVAGVTAVVPVLNEEARLGACLESLTRFGNDIDSILVVDGGSADRTRDITRRHQAQDARISLVSAAPVPPHWNGKAWGLQVGLESAAADHEWILMLDADVRLTAPIAPDLVACAASNGLDALSVATRQVVRGWAAQALHGAMLATLVYRYGVPGRVFSRAGESYLNGQCTLVRAIVLRVSDAIRESRASRCEDVTMARALVGNGVRVAVVESAAAPIVEMYTSAVEVWRGWPRSLHMRDHLSGTEARARNTAALLLALPMLMAMFALVRRWPGGVLLAQVALIMIRLGALVGLARAYERPGPGYWCSPILDVPVSLAIWASDLRRRHIWRGRALVA
ncbi:MAG: glycosyltransferase [Chloroflexota bacterium]